MNKFNGLYEYMGFGITNDSNEHEWNVEPIKTLNRNIVEDFKAEVPSLKSIVLAKKWIREKGIKIYFEIEKKYDQSNE